MKRTCLFLIIILTALVSNAVNVKFQEYQITQPDGTVINCFVSGDEFFNWIHDKDGYSIIKGSDGYYCYAVKKYSKIIASNYRVNSVNPAEVGMKKWLKISEKQYQKNRKAVQSKTNSRTNKTANSTNKGAPQIGNFNNLIIYIRFLGESEIATTRESYDGLFNAETGESLKSYFKEVSYDKLNINSVHYPDCTEPATSNVSYEDSHTRDYYEPYDASTNPNGYDGTNVRIEREHRLLKDAINWINANSPVDAGLVVDANNDGYVDNVSFIVNGVSGAWAELLWGHKYFLFDESVRINGRQVYDYTFQMEDMSDVRVLCHEMFHTIGAPDLYHYFAGSGLGTIGDWDLMCYGKGHMGAYMKFKYLDGNWISEIPEITEEGTYTLNPLTSPTNNCYKIPSPNVDDEFFVVEYRKRSGSFESHVYGDGLLVYRINPNFTGNADYNGIDSFDEVYIYCPNATTTTGGIMSQAYFSSESGRTIINDFTNPSSYLSNGDDGGLSIENVTSAGATISFDYVYRPLVEITSTEEGSTTNKEIPVSIEFSEDVTGFELSDIDVINGAVENFVQVSGSTYTIDVVPEKAGKIYVDIEEGVVDDSDLNGNYKAEQWSISFNWPVGIDKLNDAGIKIYPNPSDGMFNLEIGKEYSNCNIRVIDVTGRVLYEEVLNNLNRHQLNLMDLTQGVYIFSLSIDNKQYNDRILIQ